MYIHNTEYVMYIYIIYTVYNMKYPNMCIYIYVYIYTEMDNCEATRQILASPRSQWWKANLDKYFLVNIIHT